MRTRRDGATQRRVARTVDVFAQEAPHGGGDELRRDETAVHANRHTRARHKRVQRASRRFADGSLDVVERCVRDRDRRRDPGTLVRRPRHKRLALHVLEHVVERGVREIRDGGGQLPFARQPREQEDRDRPAERQDDDPLQQRLRYGRTGKDFADLGGVEGEVAGPQRQDVVRRHRTARADRNLLARRDDEAPVRAVLVEQSPQSLERVRHAGEALNGVDDDAIAAARERVRDALVELRGRRRVAALHHGEGAVRGRDLPREGRLAPAGPRDQADDARMRLEAPRKQTASGQIRRGARRHERPPGDAR